VDSLVQVKLLGDPVAGFSQGLTMRNSRTVSDLRFAGQQEEKNENGTTVVTRLEAERGNAGGYACEHRLTWREGTQAFTVQTVFRNTGSQPLTLEMLSSFSLMGLSPFAVDDAPEQLFTHRFRSYWAAEGRHERLPVEALHLERSWSGHSAHSERFGQAGSMPVRGFFPWAALEDGQVGVLWGAALAVPGSWQMEFYRRDDCLALSGGLADREYGHWMKTVEPGESFASPVAYVATVQGDLDDLCARLVEMQQVDLMPVPVVEEDLPVIYNEYCYSWGNPNHADLVAMADRLRGSGVKYLVIDAGWYRGDEGVWSLGQGDWLPNQNLFPEGIGATARAIRERGLVPGLWFEMEVTGDQSPRYTDTEHILKRDGLPVTAGGRHFWDFRDPWVEAYLGERVIGLLRDAGFGYIKVDYNETIGIGCDGAESPGEGLRQHLAGVERFFDRMRAEIPDLVVENCSSGGHRLEPSFMTRVSMASFSDAHETLDIPIIAANLHRLILPRQSQVWAVLHPEDPPQRFAYLLAGGFLGRLCLSGDIARLSSEQWGLTLEAIEFYRQAAPVIDRGTSRVVQAIGESWRHPRGAQVVLRIANDGERVLVVCHSFGEPLPEEIRAPLPGDWEVETVFPRGAAGGIAADGEELRVMVDGPFEAKAAILKKG
jgi:alpha-galactosidase